MNLSFESLLYTAKNHLTQISYQESVALTSFHTRLKEGANLSERQINYALNILKSHVSELSDLVGFPVLDLLNSNEFRNMNRHIKIVDDSEWKRAIQMEFPYSEELLESIKKFNRESNLGLTKWDPDRKVWLLALHEQCILFLINNFPLGKFNCDEEFLSYISQSQEIIENIEIHTPMLSYDNGQIKYKNNSRFLPILTKNDPISAAFEAKRVGISTWDESMYSAVLSSGLSKVALDFLRADATQHIDVDAAKHPLSDLDDIFRHGGPCLIIIPGGNELAHLQQFYSHLMSLGFSNNELSVLFRLPNNTGKNFNDFVRTNQLNSSISEDTKFVFISAKVPKPVLESGIVFGSTISLSKTAAHYTLKTYFHQKNFLIFYSNSLTQKEIIY